MNVVSKRYARALIEALPAELSAAGLSQLRQLSFVMVTEPDVRKLLMNPAVSTERRDAFLSRVSSAFELAPQVRKLLGLLVERRRLNLLDEVGDAYQQLLDARTGTVRVQVTSATPLAAAERRSLSESLERSTGKNVVMDVREDPAILGGIVVHIGGTVMDASLRQRLASVRHTLLAD